MTRDEIIEHICFTLTSFDTEDFIKNGDISILA